MKTLKQVQDDNPTRASCETLGITLKGEPAEVEHATQILDGYFQLFVTTTTQDEGVEFAESSPCIRCGRPQCGIFGHFIWGICTGEGYCGHCKYPARALHRIPEKDGDAEPFATLWNYILQYHPSVLSENTEQVNDEGQVVCVGS